MMQCSDKLGVSFELSSFAAGVMISTTDLAQHTLEQVILHLNPRSLRRRLPHPEARARDGLPPRLGHLHPTRTPPMVNHFRQEMGETFLRIALGE
jgi:hypothetical protein